MRWAYCVGTWPAGMILNWGGEKKNYAEEQEYYRKGRYHEKANLQFATGVAYDGDYVARLPSFGNNDYRKR